MHCLHTLRLISGSLCERSTKTYMRMTARRASAKNWRIATAFQRARCGRLVSAAHVAR